MYELSTNSCNFFEYEKISFLFASQAGSHITALRYALRDFSNLEIESRYDHIYVYLHEEDYQPVIERLADVSGIHAMSLVYRCEKDIEVIKQSALELISQETGKTYAEMSQEEKNKLSHRGKALKKLITYLRVRQSIK